MLHPTNQFCFVDLFAGIGGFRLGLETLGGVCIASSEIDKNANKVYQHNWSNDPQPHNLGNICTIRRLPAHDLLVGGVPCQSWSIAGKNRGIEDPRGKLWNEVIRLLSNSRPTAFMFENVKGLIDKRHRAALNYLVEAFEALGYCVYYRLLNSFDYGVAQNRDRIFIVGIQKDKLTEPFEWPKPIQHHLQLCDVFDNLEKSKPEAAKVTFQRNLFGERVNVGHNKLTPLGSKNQFFILTDLRNGPTSIHSWDIYEAISDREKRICMTILRNRRKPQYGHQDGNPMSLEALQKLISHLQDEELQELVHKRILRQYDDGRYEFFNRKLSGGIDGVYRVYLPSSTFFPTIMASGTLDFVATINVDGESDEAYKANFIEHVLMKKQFRRPTSAELARLQGFPNDFKHHPNPKRNIKLFGNSVAVPIVTAVGKAIQNTGCFNP